MCDDAMNVIRLWVLHAIPAWSGFTAASDRQKLDAFVRRGCNKVHLKYVNV